VAQWCGHSSFGRAGNLQGPAGPLIAEGPRGTVGVNPLGGGVGGL
jgi:hypothetical protein